MSSDPKIEKAPISAIKFDRANANKGSERGRYSIEASMREFGFADAGTLDKNNVIIGGNKRTEVAGEIGMDDAIVIDVDGTKPVYIRRKDLDLNDPDDDRARRLAYALNRSQELSLTWDAEQVLADLGAGVDLSGLWFPHELDALTGAVGEEFDPAAEWKGMPEFEQEDQTAFRRVVVHFASQQDVDSFAELVGQKLGEKTRAIWYPEAAKTNMKDIYVES